MKRSKEEHRVHPVCTAEVREVGVTNIGVGSGEECNYGGEMRDDLRHGSRLDTYPSGMARDMGGGFRVYVLRMGQSARSEDLVDTFGRADPSLLATVAEQQEYWQRWLG